METRIRIERFVTTVEYDYPTLHLTMHSYWCSVERDSLKLKEHDTERWLIKDEFNSYSLATSSFSIIIII